MLYVCLVVFYLVCSNLNKPDSLWYAEKHEAILWLTCLKVAELAPYSKEFHTSSGLDTFLAHQVDLDLTNVVKHFDFSCCILTILNLVGVTPFSNTRASIFATI